jgi:Arc/MetJ-type ribon-helix-helix transcriptional regulator
MRKVVAISMPDEMYSHLRRNVPRARYGSVSEYIRELIRKDLEAAPTHDEPMPVEEVRSLNSPLFEIRSPNDVIAEYSQMLRDGTVLPD